MDGSDDSDNDTAAHRFVQELQLPLFELSLDASSDIAELTIAVQSLNSSVTEIRVDIYNSFSFRWDEETVPSLFIALGQVPKLLKVEFYGLRLFPYKMPMSMAERTLSQANHLQEFSLMGVNLTSDAEPDGFANFSDTLRQHPALKSFCVDNCSLSDAINGLTLDEAIIKDLVLIPTLEKVVIRAIESRMWGSLSSASVKCLCSSSTLKSLELFVLYNDISLAEVAEAVIKKGKHSNLTELAVTGCLEGMVGGKAIAEMLSVNTSLRSLDLHLHDRSEDDEEGITGLAHALSKNKTLTKFQLHGATHASGSYGTRTAYLQMLEANYSLRHSLLVFNPSFLRPDNDYYAKLNRVGRGRLLQNMNTTNTEWVDALIQVRNDLDCINYFLKARPTLCSSSPSVSMDDSTVSLCTRGVQHATKRSAAHPLLLEEGDTEGTRSGRQRHKQLRTLRIAAATRAPFTPSF